MTRRETMTPSTERPGAGHSAQALAADLRRLADRIGAEFHADLAKMMVYDRAVCPPFSLAPGSVNTLYYLPNGVYTGREMG